MLASLGNLHSQSLAIFVALICGAVVLRALGSRPPRPVAKPFLTRRELAVLAILEHLLPRHRVHAQVAMGAILKAPARVGRRPKLSDRNAFSQKIVDFVVQDRISGEIVALIEVDDSSHDVLRDRARDAMTAHAGYRTIRIPPGTRPSVAEIHLHVARLSDTRAPGAPAPARR